MARGPDGRDDDDLGPGRPLPIVDDALTKTRAAFDGLNTELLQPGFVFAGRYELTERLGSGGMGIVYGAVDRRSGRGVAIKLLNHGADTASVVRFRREADAAFRVRHQHLCEVIEVGVEQGSPFIVMERLVGETLAARLTREGPLPLPFSVRITIQILEALRAAHETGVIHRDVKPPNVYVVSPPGADPWTKLIDFGVARALADSATQDEDAWSPLTAVDRVPGTPAYFSPEQLRGAPDLDARVDLWATGVTLFEMLTTRLPFEGSTYVQLTHAILREPPLRASTFRPEVPEALDAVLLKALAKNRNERYPNAAAMRVALVDLLARRVI